MKVWTFEPTVPFPEPELARAAAHVMLEARQGLPDVGDVLIFDIQTSMATRIVGLVLPDHVHGQDCGRA